MEQWSMTLSNPQIPRIVLKNIFTVSFPLCGYFLVMVAHTTAWAKVLKCFKINYLETDDKNLLLINTHFKPISGCFREIC